MSSKSLTRGLVLVPAVALTAAVVALGTSAFGGSSDVSAPSVGYAAPASATPGLAPTTTSRDWQETAVSVTRPAGGRF